MRRAPSRSVESPGAGVMTNAEFMTKLLAESHRKGLTFEKIAQLSGMKPSNVSRLFSKNDPRLSSILRLCKAIGVELRVQ